MNPPSREIEKTAELIKFVFSAPKPGISLLIMTLSSIAFGIILFPEENLSMRLFYSAMLLLFPAVISGIISKPAAEILKGIFYMRRSFLLSFICLLIVCFETVIIKILFSNVLFGIIFGYASILWLRHIVLVGTSNSNHLLSLPASSTQTLSGIVFIYIMFPFGAHELILALLWVSIFLGTAVAFMEFAKIPMKKSFGVNGLELLKDAIAHFTENSLRLERFFESIGEEVNAEIKVLCFRTKETHKVKALILLPYHIHPGPFGTLGGSNLPAKISCFLKYPAFVMHSASGHESNPVSTEECLKIARKLAENIDKMGPYCSSGSEYISCPGKYIDVSAQYLGNSLLLVCSSKKPADDLDFNIGDKITSALESKHRIYSATEKVSIDNSRQPLMLQSIHLLFADAHSSLERGASSIYFNTEEAKEIIALSETAALNAKHNSFPIKAGVGIKDISVSDIGEKGIQALVIETDKKKVCYLLFDGNNMRPATREKIRASLKGVIEYTDILTTDNHSVNVTMHGFNPVGTSNTDFGSIARSAVQKAVEDLEPVEVCTESIPIKINVLGEKNIAKLTSSINSTISLLKILFPATICTIVFACSLAYLYI